MDSRRLAAIVLADLGTILERTRSAYLERMPELGRLSPEGLAAVLEATRRTMEQFCRYYVEGTLDADSWQTVRDATVDRAGDVFSHEQILEIMNVARAVGVEVVRELSGKHPELTESERAKLAKAIDRYITEIAEQEDRLRRMVSPGRLATMLADLEAEGADLQ